MSTDKSYKYVDDLLTFFETHKSELVLWRIWKLLARYLRSIEERNSVLTHYKEKMATVKN
ncbi:CLUMA_CG012524, isoform A [Clunio marinus]|uniref:CLUMA_CG012524, isoform A n=1 Tax=Clunio marinus TaxID=568069 RepID=A0A1J1IG63_9DIPT|nr:CLUMA_CG012524, isoform A [Clunio marinus]